MAGPRARRSHRVEHGAAPDAVQAEAFWGEWMAEEIPFLARDRRRHDTCAPYACRMDLSLLYRLKGTLEGTAANENGNRLGGGYVTAWPRLRREVVEAVPDHRAEIDRLFPEQLSTGDQAGDAQSEESIMLMAQLAGWLGGVIAEAEVQQRLAAQLAEASKPPMGFGVQSQVAAAADDARGEKDPPKAP